MEGNIAHKLIVSKHFSGYYDGDLQRSVVLLVHFVTYNTLLTKKVARILGVFKLSPSIQKSGHRSV